MQAYDNTLKTRFGVRFISDFTLSSNRHQIDLSLHASRGIVEIAHKHK